VGCSAAVTDDAPPTHHRTAHPDDPRTFAPDALPALRRAVAEVSWLLGRGYPLSLAVRAAGDRHQLTDRARLAVTRAAASPEDCDARAARLLPCAALRGARLDVDLFNVLITLELALGGGALLRCADGPLRDLAGLRGSYRLVVETEPAARALLAHLASLDLARCVLWIDAPVSNSGRLRALLEDLAAGLGAAVELEMVPDADAAMRGCAVAASADAVVIDGAARWCNLAREVVDVAAPGAWVIDLAARP